MFLKNLIACIKVNGQILRDSDDIVTLPFGSEYVIHLKNLNSVRIQIAVSVDGQLATEDRKLIIEPNSSLELERFIKGGNLHAGNKFKFIERTADIEKHRGVGSDDGLVRVEAWREIPPVQWYSLYSQTGISFNTGPAQGGILRGMNMTGGSPSAGNASTNSGNPSTSVGGQQTNSNKMSRQRQEAERCDFQAQSLSDVGITVPGSESRQQFINVAGFPVEAQSTVIVLRLRGQVGDVPVVTPVVVNAKRQCSSCGKVSKTTAEFCPKCGTALVTYA